MKKMKRKILVGASGGLLAGVLLAGAGTAYADTADYSLSATATAAPSGMHLTRRWNSDAKVGGLASSLGLDKREIQQELKEGKSLKQILQEHGIVLDQLNKAFTYGNGSKKKKTTGQ